MYGEEYLQKSGHCLGLRNAEDTISHNGAALGVLNLGSVDYSTDNDQRSKGEKYFVLDGDLKVYFSRLYSGCGYACGSIQRGR